MICSNFKIDPGTNILYREIPVPVPDDKPNQTKPNPEWHPDPTLIADLKNQKEQTPPSEIQQLVRNSIDLQIQWLEVVLNWKIDSQTRIQEHRVWVITYTRILTTAFELLGDDTKNKGLITTFIEEFIKQFQKRVYLPSCAIEDYIPTVGYFGPSPLFNFPNKINFSHMIESEYFTVDGVKYIRRKTTNNTYLKSKFDGNLYIEAVDRVIDQREYEETDIEIEDAEVEAEEKTEETNEETNEEVEGPEETI